MSNRQSSRSRPEGRRNARFTRLAAVAFGLLVAIGGEAGAALAQEPVGLLRGRVVDENQQPVGGANIELLQQGRVLRRALSNSSGVFQFPALDAGVYQLRASQIGYERSPTERVRVAGGEVAMVTLTLPLQPVELEGVAVTASPLTIERQNTEFSTRIREQQLALLPTHADPKDIISVTPGARADHVWGGATMQANNYQLDGLPANHPGIGGDLVTPSINWIERIEVKGLGAGAQYGNFQGGLINVVTKSGTNDFQGAFRSTVESHHLNARNLVETDVGSETHGRYDTEAEVRGPIVKDRLFYYLAGQLVQDDRQHLNHVPFQEGMYLPQLEERDEKKVFGKVTWTPTSRDRVEGSFGYFDTTVENYGLSGYEAPGSALRLTAPTHLYSLAWDREWSDWFSTDAKLARFSLDQTRAPYAGPDAPGMQFYGLHRIYPPEATFLNAPIHYRHAPESTTGAFISTFRFDTWGHESRIDAGIEHSVGSFLDQRRRSGGMTWRPTRRPSLDPQVPSSWPYPPSDWVPLATGGEVDLHAEVENSAAFVQSSFALGRHAALSPGLRFGRWVGRLLPGGDRSAMFTAVEDQAIDPRIGLMVDFTGNNTFVAKAHWGRYHQSMVAQFFDRAEGGNVFTNERHWFYDGPLPADPATSFSEAERQRMVDAGELDFYTQIILNETGPVGDYRQPYIDQWIVGLEKTFGGAVRLEAVYVNRRNRDMVALVDINRETNYTAFERVRVYDSSGQPIEFEGGHLQISTLYLPNNRLSDHLKCWARGPCEGSGFGGAPPPPPGLTYADTLNLTWDPQYVLTNAPDAQRKFDQLQLSFEVNEPTWGASGSWVFTNLEGNLDNVTGYDDPSGYGAGPYVRVNESVNSYGKLPNFAEQEMKAAVWGDIFWDLKGGLFWTKTSGDHYSPRFTLTGTGLYQFRTYDNQVIHHGYAADMEGHNIFIGPRGFPKYHDWVRFDVHLERELRLPRTGVTLSLDVFNVFNYSTATRYNESVNYGRNYYHFLPGGNDLFQNRDPNQFYRATLERIPPRTIRLGTVIRF